MYWNCLKKRNSKKTRGKWWFDWLIGNIIADGILKNLPQNDSPKEEKSKEIPNTFVLDSLMLWQKGKVC